MGLSGLLVYFKCCSYFSRPEILLSGEINLKVSLKGFPTPVTSALSMPSPQTSDPYEHYVFSGRKKHAVVLILLITKQQDWGLLAVECLS